LISVTVPIGRRGEEKRIDLDLDKVRGGDQANARATLDPHLAIGVETCAPRAASASPEERAERVGVPVRVGSPVLDARVDDVELEGEDVLEDVRAGRGWVERGERVEDVRRFC
jgi:hypothetical protein